MADSSMSCRDRLVDAALAVFAREGVDAASIKKIGRAAGVAQALIYHYVESKEALLAAVVKRHGFLPQFREMLGHAHDCGVAVEHVLERISLGIVDPAGARRGCHRDDLAGQPAGALQFGGRKLRGCPDAAADPKPA
jgi:AcrR family transcriptional regulator